MPEPYRFYLSDDDSLMRRGLDGLDTPQGWVGDEWMWFGGYGAPGALTEITAEEAAQAEPDADLQADDPEPGHGVAAGGDDGEEEDQAAEGDGATTPEADAGAQGDSATG